MAERERKREERDCHATDAYVEQWLAPNAVNESDAHDRCNHIHRGYDQRRQDGVGVRGASRELKNLRTVIDDGVDAGDLLQNGEARCNEKRAAHRGTPESAPALFHRCLKSQLNVIKKTLCPDVIHIDTQYGCSVLSAAVGEQPARTLGNRKNYSQEEDC